MFALGKKPAVIDLRVPSLHRLKAGAPMPAPPSSVNWLDKVQALSDLRNNDIGLCTVAGCLHIVQTLSANAGREIVPDDACSLDDYVRATALFNPPGYDPATDTNDSGLTCHDILQFWMTKGLAVFANGSLDLLDGYASIEPGDTRMLQSSAYVFGSLAAGLELPESASDETTKGLPWADTSGAVGGWGGHFVDVGNFDADGLTCITWGKRQRMTWAWWKKYGSELFVPLRRTWLGSNGLSPSHFTMDQLTSWINDMRGELGIGAVTALPQPVV